MEDVVEIVLVFRCVICVLGVPHYHELLARQAAGIWDTWVIVFVGALELPMDVLCHQLICN